MTASRARTLTLLILALAAMLLTPGAVPARDGQESMLFLDEDTVSTPSRRPHPLDQSPAPVSVIGAERIRRSGALTIPEALALLPGVDIIRQSEMNAQVSVRGFNGYTSNKVLVMLDSRPVFNLADASVDWNLIPVSLDDIERIELVRGPGSVLYGENAFFGIVNIITKSPGGNDFRVRAGGGKESTGRFHVSGSSDGIRASSEWIELNRFGETGSDIGNPVADERGITPIHVRSVVQRAFLSAEKRAGGGRLRAGGGVARVENIFSDYRDIDRAAFASLGYSMEAADLGLDFSLQGGYRDQETDAMEELRGEPYREFYRGDFEVQGIYSPAASDTLVFGGRVSYRNIRDDYYLGPGEDREDRWTSSAYAENQAAFFDKRLFLVTGVRLDHYEEFDDVVSPRIGLILILTPRQAVKAGWGQAYRGPTLYELYGRDNSQAPFIFHGNDELDPERITGWNLDYVYHDPGRLLLTAGLYYNDIEDLAVFELKSIDLTRALYQLENAEEGYSYGGETELRVTIGDHVDIWGNYAYAESYYVREGHRVVAPFSPRHKGVLGMDLEFPGLEFSVWSAHQSGYVATPQNTPFQDRLEMKGHSALSASLTMGPRDGLSVSVSGHDILGRGHYDSPVFAPVMPWYFVEISFGGR